MEIIIVEEDPTEAIRKIINADGPVYVKIFGHSCNGGSVFDMVELSTALKNCKYPTTAMAMDCVSLIPFVGAGNIDMDDRAFLYIAPLSIALSPYNSSKDINELNRFTKAISESYSRWPKAKELFDSGEEYFISKEKATAMGIICPAIKEG